MKTLHHKYEKPQMPKIINQKMPQTTQNENAQNNAFYETTISRRNDSQSVFTTFFQEVIYKFMHILAENL